MQEPFRRSVPPRAGVPGTPGVPAPKAPLLRPRKVRGGVKLGAGEGVGEHAIGWAAQRWSRVVELAAEGSRLREGLEYAKLGQTRRMTIASGVIESQVQGRSDRAYTTTLRFEVFSAEQWEKVVASMAEGAIYAAKLLSGELPASIEDLFAPMGLKLFPGEPGEMRVSCNCGDSSAWCKHVCCIAHLFASRLSSEPFLMFSLRGIDPEDLQERLRQRRTAATSTQPGQPGSALVYSQRIPGVDEGSRAAIDSSPEQFWEAGPQLQELELLIAPPQVSHPLLRRLGQSPFPNAPFPLVGLLASCYESISEEALHPKEASTGMGEGESVPIPE